MLSAIFSKRYKWEQYSAVFNGKSVYGWVDTAVPNFENSYHTHTQTKQYHLWHAVYCVKFHILFDLSMNLTLNLLTTTIVAPPSNASKWQMGFNSAFKGLNSRHVFF